MEHPIAYASHMLSKLEQNYDAHKLEFLALKWAVTDCFHEYLYGAKVGFKYIFKLIFLSN